MPEKTSPSPVNPFKKMTAAAKRASTFGLAAIVLSILASLLAWFAWQEIHDVTTQIKVYANQLSNQTTSATQKMENTIDGFQTKLNLLQNKFDTLQGKFNQLSNISIQAHNQRALSEASYLIHMANLQLLISHDPNAALNLMMLANKQLDQISSPNVVALKHAVAKDLVALKKTPRINTAQLLARLNQVEMDVQNLPAFPTEPPSPTASTDKQSTTALPWYKKLGNSLNGLKQFVIIRHNKKPIKPLLSEEQLLFLKQNVQLKILHAQWAVLDRNSELYQQSLTNAQQLLEEHYPDQNAMTNVLNDITALLKVDIAPELPDLSNTLKTLNTTSMHTSAVSHTPIPKQATAVVGETQ